MPGSATLLPDRLLCGAGVVLTCVLFTRSAADPVNVLKLSALLLVALALAARAGHRLVRERRAHLPLSPAGAVAAGLVGALTLVWAAAPVSATAVLGTYGRNSGLLAYLAAIVLFLTALRVFHDQHGRVLLAGVVVAAAFTATYGLLQKVGWDAIPWNNPFNPIIAALGNPNFASGYLGIGAATAVGGALYRGWHVAWRVAAAATALLCIVAAALSASVQGPIAAAGGLFVVAVGVLLDLRSRQRKLGLAGLGVTAGAAVCVLLLGAVAKTGPAARLFSDVGSEARTHYWRGALTMLTDHPVLGVGLDQYGNFWWSSRTPEAIAALGPGQFSDAAHSVPLQMLAQGGLVLGVAYAALVLFTLVCLVRGLTTLTGDRRALLAALGGGWAAYQVQSLVSIDQVPLIALHFALAGSVVAASGHAGLREVRLPGALATPPAPATSGRRRQPQPLVPKVRRLTAVDAAALSALAAVVLVAAWFALVPLRANIAAKQGDDLLARGDGTGALAAYERAVELVPGQSLYRLKKGDLFQRLNPPETARALAAFREAAAVNPYEPGTFRAAARHAEQLEALDEARRLYASALEVDPLGPETLSAAAQFELRHSGAVTARSLLEGALARLADVGASTAPLWASLGDARAVLKDPTAAREAYDRALVLQPGEPTAVSGLEKLAAAGA